MKPLTTACSMDGKTVFVCGVFLNLLRSSSSCSSRDSFSCDEVTTPSDDRRTALAKMSMSIGEAWPSCVNCLSMSKKYFFMSTLAKMGDFSRSFHSDFRSNDSERNGLHCDKLPSHRRENKTLDEAVLEAMAAWAMVTAMCLKLLTLHF